MCSAERTPSSDLRWRSLALTRTLALNPVDLPRERTVEPQDAHRALQLGRSFGIFPPFTPLSGEDSLAKGDIRGKGECIRVWIAFIQTLTVTAGLFLVSQMYPPRWWMLNDLLCCDCVTCGCWNSQLYVRNLDVRGTFLKTFFKGGCASVQIAEHTRL